MRHSKIIAVIAGVLTCGVAQAGDVYKYVDERGQTLYTDKPIPGAVKVASTTPRPTDAARVPTPRSRPPRISSSPRATSASRRRRTTTRVAANVAKDLEASRLERCKKARSDYKTSINSQRLYNVDKDGNRVYLSDAELPQRRLDARQGRRRHLRPPGLSDPLSQHFTDAAPWAAFSLWRWRLNAAPGNATLIHSAPMSRVGFAGLGAMGAPMARNLHKAGLLTAVWNRSREKATALGTELGVAAPADLGEFATQVDVVVICVSADADVLAVVEALAPGLAPRRAASSTVPPSAPTPPAAPRAARRIAACVSRCPVSGGVEGAKNGTLAIMWAVSQRPSTRHGRCSLRSARPSSTSVPAAAARRPRPPTRSCAPASSAPVPRPWHSRTRTSCRSSAWSRRSARARARAGTSCTARPT